MSHFTRVQTKITSLAQLKKTLDELGWAYETGRFQVRDYHGNRVDVDVLVHTGQRHDVGFRQAGGHYEMVGDWWGVRGYRAADVQTKTTQMETETRAREREAEARARREAEARAREIENQIRQQYAYQTVREQLAKLNDYTLAEETTEADGTIRLVVRHWG